jgi:hypothetical protein
MVRTSIKNKIAAGICAGAFALAMPAFALAANSPVTITATDPEAEVSVTAQGEDVADLHVTVAQEEAPQAQVEAEQKGQTILASFEVTGTLETTNADGQTETKTVTLSFNVGKKYAGASGTVYIQHNDGTTESKNVGVNVSGIVTVTVNKLSVYTLAVDESTVGTYAYVNDPTVEGYGTNTAPEGVTVPSNTNQSTGDQAGENQANAGQAGGNQTNAGQSASNTGTVNVNTSATSPQTGVNTGLAAGAVVIAACAAAGVTATLRKRVGGQEL